MKHFKEERTLVVVKPDGVQRSLVGEIVLRHERLGLKLVAMKMFVPAKAHIEEHYLLDPSWKRNVGEKTIGSYLKKGLKPPTNDPVKVGDKVLAGLIRYLSSGPVVAMVWEGAHAVAIVRKIVGGTEPLTSDVGTIRGDFVLDSYEMSDTDGRAVRNLIHASGSVAEANSEIPHWFKPSELFSYRHVQEKILYDADFNWHIE